ncbi:hypothetical protein O1W68_19875 [Rhodococcus sp. H36-A4]|uniref:hypothetical protein n=1 Tax=unclassified Rhodococcus (in: high G+C Gram-positive bacteria) TaxID=192944 RepID=UPI0022AE6954|nr:MULTISPECIES: hypothetical protein [unclassified Rhodococcus (in: high G+C Gram-positive bacteria)]MCZ4080209.1 hypothetical protein [Rhodococcus sp. H36-A4]MDJ0362928.1 hypothetical protein [Rhodococcus sp. H29-C3]
MMDSTSKSWTFVSAIFSYEFQGGGVDYDTIEMIHRGDVHEWIVALELSGLFDRAVVEHVEITWKRQPRLLLDTLLVDADEMTRKRCDMAWASLDRLAPIAQSG